MNKQVIFVPQVCTTTESLKLSVAVELLYNRVCTMEVQFSENPEALSLEDWEDFIKCAKFLNEHGGKTFGNISEVESYLALEYAKAEQKENNKINLRYGLR